MDRSKVDVWNFTNKKTLAVINNLGRYEISVDLFDLEFVHESHNRCTSASNIEGPKKGECSCRELRIVTAMISAKVNAKPKHPTEVHVIEKLQLERLLHYFIQGTKK